MKVASIKFHVIRPEGTLLILVDRRTDGRVEVNSRFWRLLGKCLRSGSLHAQDLTTSQVHASP